MPAMNAEAEQMEAANHEAVDDLYGQVNNMRHVRRLRVFLSHFAP